MRGTERKQARDAKEDLIGKLEKAESLEETRTVLESTLFRLQNVKGEPTTGNGKTTDSGGGGAAGAVNGDEVLGANLRALSPSPPSVSKLDIVFDERLGKEKDRGKLVRYQINPRANWGPMNRASGA
jgi:tRNA (guanine26-N2/guanine27-N2)-dimethyltransferase